MNARFAAIQRALVSGALVAGLLWAPSSAFAAATITIVNADGPGEGFNDPTPAAPMGGNPGTTVGEQRLIAFQFAADIWGSTLDSNVEIFVLASFDPLPCTATSAALGSAGATFIFANFPSVAPFPGPGFPDTWHSSALADKRAGIELNPGEADLRARFNTHLGAPGCLTGIGWYYGLDSNHGSQIDLVTVLLHEFAHGLGFQQFANLTSGSQFNNWSDVYGRNLFDKTQGKTWDQMTDHERVASAVNSRKVVWNGLQVSSDVPKVLSPGTPVLTVHLPAAIAGNYAVGAAAFGPPLSSPGVTGNVVQALDPADGAGPSTFDACSPITNAAAIAGNIALIDRGSCTFVTKVKNAQNAGAIAVIIADNVGGSPPGGLGGTDPTIVIPSARITLADGDAIKAQLGPGVNVTLGVDLSILAGADETDRALMNAPNPLQPGSSISHWDPIAFRNQLMEPAINADLTHSLRSPEDLTLALMRDIGWFGDADLDGTTDEEDCEPESDLRATVVFGSCNSEVPNTLFPDGCTIADRIQQIAASARNHGALVSGVARLTNQLVAQRIITSDQKGAIQSCVARRGRMTMPQAWGETVPERFALRFAGSNPARGGMSADLDLPQAAVVELRVYDVRGALVRTLARAEFTAGRHTIQWDGRDEGGRRAVAGVYFVRASMAEATENLRFVLLH